MAITVIVRNSDSFSPNPSAGVITRLLYGLWLNTEPPPSSLAPTQRGRMLNRLKAVFHSEPFNRALYSMSAPGQCLKNLTLDILGC